MRRYSSRAAAVLLLLSFCIPYHHPTSRRRRSAPRSNIEETSLCRQLVVLPAALEYGANTREIHTHMMRANELSKS